MQLHPITYAMFPTKISNEMRLKSSDIETKAVYRFCLYKIGVWLVLLFVHGESQSNILNTCIFIVALNIIMQYEMRSYFISIRVKLTDGL